MNNLVFQPAHKLAQLIRDRAVSAVEVLEAHLNQIANHNPKLNAICTLDEKSARQQAQQADEALARGETWGILHGVPVTIKDTLETARLRTTAGSKSLRDYIPQTDATAVARLRSAGAIIIGKTNLSKLGGDYQSSNDLFARTNNPWNLNYTPGGSSGGAAAAIAAGFSALELGSDFGGSIRQPCHFCGVFGLKPTDRRVSTAGHIPELPGMPRHLRQMLTIGPLARTVEDLQLCFSLIAGSDPRQPEIPPVGLDTPSYKSLQNLRVAWTDEFTAFPVAQTIKQKIRSVAQKLADSGVEIEQWQPKFDFVAAWKTYYAVGCYNLIYSQQFDFKSVRESMAFLFREATQGERSLRELSNVPGLTLPIFLNPTLKGYFEALTERDRYIAHMDEALKPWDILLCPVAMTPAFTHRPQGEAVEIDGQKVPYQMASGAYVVPFNLTGHPVVVLPIGSTLEGLPIGMQIVGKRWQEMELLTITQELNKVVGDFQSPAGY